MKQNKADLGLGGGTLMQVANRSLTQMMSYLIDTPDGGVIVIDGGYYCAEDSENLYKLLAKRGKRVDLWIVTHAHCDHLGALLWLTEKRGDFDIEIKKLCFHFPSEQWLVEKEDWQYNERFFRAIEKYKINVITPQARDILHCGGISVEIVSVPEKYEGYPSINATSMIFVVHFPKRDVLFLGDFDVHGQEEFLQKYDLALIRKDIVQMSHHGQQGVNFAFYQLIAPKICLYPTPQWLWENNRYRCTDPATAGSGPFTIMETREWMVQLGVEKSYVQAEGDWIFY